MRPLPRPLPLRARRVAITRAGTRQVTRCRHSEADFARGRCLRIHLRWERLVERDASVRFVRLDAQRMILLLHQSPHETANSEPCKQARKRTARKRRGRLPSASLVSVPWFRVWHRRPSCKKRRPQRWTTAPHRRVYVQALADGLDGGGGYLSRVNERSSFAMSEYTPYLPTLDYSTARRGEVYQSHRGLHATSAWHDTRPQAQMQQRAVVCARG